MRLHHAIGIQKVFLNRFSISNPVFLRRKLWLYSTAEKPRAYISATASILHDGPGYTEQVSQSLSKSVRKAMRRVPHPVMVITASALENGLVGLVVSSFNTVTLHPEPLVSFNIKVPSSTYDRIIETGEFTATSISSIETANIFTRPLSQMAKVKNLDPAGMIRGAIFSFRCSWLKEKSIEVGDHFIMVGRVIGYTHNQMPSQEASEGPLMYCNGRYWKAP